jgi:fibronectin-binding autotransporter adhesin
MRGRRTRARFVAAAVSALASGVARAQVDGTWIGPAGGSWTVGGNWTSDPAFPSAGGTATFADTGTQSVSLGAGTLLLGALHFNTEAQVDIAAATFGTNVKFVGPSLIDLAKYKQNKPGVAAYYLGDTLTPQITFDTAAVNITGPGALYYNTPNTTGWTGDLSIINATYTFSNYYALGVGSHAATLNGATLRALSTGAINAFRAFNLVGAGATLEINGQGNYNAPITGTGGLTVTGAAAGSFTLSSSCTYTGATRVVGGGSVALTLDGAARLAGTSSVAVSGALDLFPRFGNVAGDFLNDNGLALRGATLTLGKNGTDFHEHIGTLSQRGGLNTIAFIPVSTGTFNTRPLNLSAATLDRQDRAVLRATSTAGQFGGGLSNSVVRVKFDDNGASLPLIGGGGAAGTTNVSIVPFAFIDVNTTNAPPGFMTYDSGGLRPLAFNEYDTALPADAVSDHNVRSGGLTVPAPQTINALSSLGTSMNLQGLSTSTLTITSGAVYGVHNFVPLDFGAAEGVFTNGGVHAPISGTGGVTYTHIASVGNGSLVIDPGVSSTYTGQSTINLGTIAIRGDVLPNTPGPLGADSTPVVLMGRTVGATILNPFTPTISFGRDLIVKADPELYNGNAPTLRGFINVTGNMTLEGPLGVEPTVSLAGNISGPGRLFAVGTFNSGSSVFLGGNNSFTGGVDLGAGTWTAGSDTAFGTGTVWVGDGPGGGTTAFIRSAAVVVGAPSRTFANPFLLFDDVTFAIQSPQTMTLNGPIDLNGEAHTIRVNGGFPAPNLASLIINGNITGGDLRTSGVIQLSGENSQWSTRIDNGRLRVSSNYALGVAPKFTQIGAGTPNGANVPELDLVGGVTIPAHPLVFTGPGLPTLRSTGGASNTWLGPALVIGNGTFIVDAGATLTIAGGITDNIGTLSGAHLLTVGPGTLNTPFVRVDSAATEFFLNSGTTRILPDGTDAGVSRVGSFLISGGAGSYGGKLDLTDNALVYDYPGSVTPFSDIRDMLKSGYNNGSWNGNGITSSSAAAAVGSAHPTALGWLDNFFTPLPATFRGQLLDSGALVVAYTLAGDANLDSTVDLTDFTFLASNFNRTVNGWWQGDFNYDGKVDLTDFTLLAANFNQTLVAGGGSPGSVGATVPEPTIPLVCVGAVTLLTKRRRRTTRRAAHVAPPIL